jgi:trimethylamine--corrinoid protein Co-methyltransferase
MKTEFLYPQLADRRDTASWEKDGSPDIYEQAHQRVKTMLKDYYPAYIPPDVDSQIRQKFDIRLKPEEMKRGNGRW